MLDCGELWETVFNQTLNYILINHLRICFRNFNLMDYPFFLDKLLKIFVFKDADETINRRNKSQQ